MNIQMELQEPCDFGFFYIPITKSVKLSQSGSNRIYYRLFDNNDHSYIGVVGTSINENIAFITLSDYLNKQGVNTPKVLAVSNDKLRYIQEDLGDISLFSEIEKCQKNNKLDDNALSLLSQSIRQLAYLQIVAAHDLDYSVCYPQPAFDNRNVLWDLNYFKYCFLKPSGLEFHENLLEDDFQKMVEILTNVQPQGFMYRDFQSRNIMIYQNKPYFIDFQGGRKGPIHYDVASFLWQAKANFSQSLRDTLIDVYLDEINKYTKVDKISFKQTLKHFVLFRTLQVLGAYGFRGWSERKAHFIQSIPFAINNLKTLLEDDFPQYPYLIKVLHELTQLPNLQFPMQHDNLIVTVYSFSYKKGLPQDSSGNGGGYVFDCRAVHNPGKYEQFKSLTGLDKPVQDFLEKDGEILKFLDSAYSLIDASIERYIKRGFTDLMISFGCTGGQHRSAYSALKTAEHIRNKYKIKVHLIHRELGINELK
ncbi:MAG: phosphotransferase [Paludibacteraceae bacterium]|nr:phosphotransferase [Paludibacteraceae bacterium]